MAVSPRAAAAEPPGQATENPPKTSAPAAGAAAPYPWELESQHRFIWFHGEETVGETKFRVSDLPRPGRPGERVLEIRATRAYQRAAVTQNARGTTLVTPGGLPLRFQEHLQTYHSTTGTTGTQETDFVREPGKGRIRYVHNGKTHEPVVREDPMPEGAFLCANQALEHWAIFAATLPRDTTSRTLKLYYPDHRRLYDLKLDSVGDETLTIAKREVVARKYRFRTPEKAMSGQLWITASGRLIQVEFPSTNVRVVWTPGTTAPAKKP